MKFSFLAIVLALITAESADACNRCGLFGNRCRYYKAPAIQYVPAAQVVQPNILVVQNSYPQPIAQQGSTVYSYQQAALQYSVNPQELFRQAADFSRASIQSSQLAISGYNQLAQQQLLLQSRIAEPLARGYAASQILNAAGLNQSYPQQAQSLSLRIYADSNGEWKVEQGSPSPYSATQKQSSNSPVQADDYSAPQQKGNPQQAPQSASILSTKCYKCHSAQSTQLKGKLYLDRYITTKTLRESILRLKSNDPQKRMPPPSEGNLTPGEMAQVLDELLELSAPPSVDTPVDEIVPPAPVQLPNQ